MADVARQFFHRLTVAFIVASLVGGVLGFGALVVEIWTERPACQEVP